MALKVDTLLKTTCPVGALTSHPSYGMPRECHVGGILDQQTVPHSLGGELQLPASPGFFFSFFFLVSSSVQGMRAI